MSNEDIHNAQHEILQYVYSKVDYWSTLEYVIKHNWNIKDGFVMTCIAYGFRKQIDKSKMIEYGL